MTPKQFCRHYPQLYHMAESGSWKSISKYGLLSTCALVDLFGVKGCKKTRLVSQRRPESEKITHPEYGTATIRDNKVITDSKLKKWLIGMSPTAWYETLNRKVFFWTTRDRLIRLLGARAYRSRSHTVITIVTQTLLEHCFDRITLSPINTGAMPFGGSPRGVGTFQTLEEWSNKENSRSGKLTKPVVELAVEHSVLNIKQFAVRVDEMRGEKIMNRIWVRS